MNPSFAIVIRFSRTWESLCAALCGAQTECGFSLLGLKISRNLADELGRSQSVLAELLESDRTFVGWAGPR